MKKQQQCMLFNTLKECEKISYIEVIVELKYLGVLVQLYKQRETYLKNKRTKLLKTENKKLSVMTYSFIEKSCHWVMMGKTYWKGVVLPSGKRSIRSRSNRHEMRTNRLIAKSREHCNEKNLESTKVGCTSSNKRRDRNKQHEGKNSKEHTSIPKKDRNRK